MKRRSHFAALITIVLSALLVTSCLLPGMIPMDSAADGPRPVMETDGNAVIKVLSGPDWHYLQALAKERYTEEDLAGPATLTYTVTITDDLPTYFVYGWCAVDEATLQQNFEHITIGLYFNDERLKDDVVQTLTYTSPDNLVCLDFGVLMSEWSNGTYHLKSVATFEEKLNDGMADYEPGDYVFEYTVTVKKPEQKSKEGA